MKIQSYQDLIVWQKGIELVKEIYKISKLLPQEEKFILVSQMTRASISIPSNIAEGWARNRKGEFVRFMEIAFGSSSELATQLIIAKFQYAKVDYSKAESLNIEVQKMLSKLINNTKISERSW